MGSFADGRALAIANPVAGGGRVQRRLEDLVKIFRETGARVDVVRTPAPGEGTRIAREAVEEGYARVIAIGGDGTVNEVLNGLLGTDTELAVVPLGSANDFAFALGLHDWRQAARLAVTGTVRPIDVAVANGRAFANCAGVGVDAAGARRVERHKRAVGPLGYLTAAVRTLATYRPQPVRVHFDGEVIIGKHLLVVASNGERFANGMRIAPGATIDDGLLDICVVGDTSLPESIALLAKVYRGAHVGHPKVRMLKVREVVIEQERVLPMELDGEVGTADRLDVRCVPGGVAVVAPDR